MKKIYYLIIIVAASLVSCGDFLDESSQDKIIAKTTRDYSEMIYGECYHSINNTSGINSYLDIMTDDCKEFASVPSVLSPDNRINVFGYWAWQPEPEYPYEGVLQNDKTWGMYYRHILLSNITLHDLPGLPGDENDKTFLRGECHLIRAFAYFMLVNIYGEPYRPETAASAKGVPLNNLTEASVVALQRASVAEVYAQIKSDLKEGLEALKESDGDPSIFRWNHTAACLFASRVALYMRDYDEVIRYADMVLEDKYELYNLESKMKNNTDLFFHNKNNPEILFSYGVRSAALAFGAACLFEASDELMGLYVTGDLRASKGTTAATRTGQYIRQQGGSDSFFPALRKPWKNTQYKYDTATSTLVFAYALRISEAYLNRAEAYACRQNPDLAKAVADLNTIRMNRFKAASYADLSAGSQSDVVELVKRERRLELCFEQHRWFDLKRYDTRPRIVHTFQTTPGTASSAVTYVLEANDESAYVLPAPQAVLLLDPHLDDVRRPERNPVE